MWLCVFCAWLCVAVSGEAAARPPGRSGFMGSQWQEVDTQVVRLVLCHCLKTTNLCLRFFPFLTGRFLPCLWPHSITLTMALFKKSGCSGGDFLSIFTSLMTHTPAHAHTYTHVHTRVSTSQDGGPTSQASGGPQTQGSYSERLYSEGSSTDINLHFNLLLAQVGRVRGG